MNKTEEIIKCAIEGNFTEAPNWEFQHANQYWAIWKNENGDLTNIDIKHYFLDPKFFQAIGKAKGWLKNQTSSKYRKFMMVNYHQSFDGAIDYLYNLIK